MSTRTSTVFLLAIALLFVVFVALLLPSAQAALATAYQRQYGGYGYAYQNNYNYATRSDYPAPSSYYSYGDYNGGRAYYGMGPVPQYGGSGYKKASSYYVDNGYSFYNGRPGYTTGGYIGYRSSPYGGYSGSKYDRRYPYNSRTWDDNSYDSESWGSYDSYDSDSWGSYDRDSHSNGKSHLPSYIEHLQRVNTEARELISTSVEFSNALETYDDILAEQKAEVLSEIKALGSSESPTAASCQFVQNLVLSTIQIMPVAYADIIFLNTAEAANTEELAVAAWELAFPSHLSLGWVLAFFMNGVKEWQEVHVANQHGEDMRNVMTSHLVGEGQPSTTPSTPQVTRYANVANQQWQILCEKALEVEACPRPKPFTTSLPLLSAGDPVYYYSITLDWTKHWKEFADAGLQGTNAQGSTDATAWVYDHWESLWTAFDALREAAIPPVSAPDFTESSALLNSSIHKLRQWVNSVEACDL